jgi:formamidopyrimidine-DNA glycosylase
VPERPDLEYLIPRLADGIVGRSFQETRVCDPVVVRVGAEGTLDTLLRGRRVVALRRRLHFVVFDLDPGELTLAVHPMLAGRFRVGARSGAEPRDTCVIWHMSDQVEVRYADDVRMGKVILMPSARMDTVPGWSPVGTDVTGPGWGPNTLRALLKGRRDQVKLFLMDKSAVDAFGNAYADEVLWAAGIHPKRRCSELSAPEVDRLAASMPAVLQEAAAEVQRRAPPLDEKVRDFLHVRRKAGEPCSRCGAKVRTVGVRGHDAFFCPICQPDVAGRGLVDWRRT